MQVGKALSKLKVLSACQLTGYFMKTIQITLEDSTSQIFIEICYFMEVGDIQKCVIQYLFLRIYTLVRRIRNTQAEGNENWPESNIGFL